MTDAVSDAPSAPSKASKLPLILGLVLAVAGGAGGFLAVSSGLLSTGEKAEAPHESPAAEALPDIAYVPLDPIIITLSGNRNFQLLRFRAQIEVESRYREDIEKITPRIVDVLNGYLRALEVADLSDPSALSWLRGQMLRRIQIVTGKERVRDLLIMEFVLN